eukprot:CAMPEP_0175433720 /NCGR_PEP_ID=MMETSP0095-20121207/53538_1 /TAXON_ID=311494 /ORGANISM="Alexandrium monilatum, Strain CCMP3105" /LENGTH=124 /DNA_ID=CAMNT_0016733247 /DNA_START=80 /DNA_END=454 /DNA_ORIENTATION=-
MCGSDGGAGAGGGAQLLLGPAHGGQEHVHPHEHGRLRTAHQALEHVGRGYARVLRRRRVVAERARRLLRHGPRVRAAAGGGAAVPPRGGRAAIFPALLGRPCPHPPRPLAGALAPPCAWGRACA